MNFHGVNSAIKFLEEEEVKVAEEFKRIIENPEHTKDELDGVTGYCETLAERARGNSMTLNKYP